MNSSVKEQVAFVVRMSSKLHRREEQDKIMSEIKKKIYFETNNLLEDGENSSSLAMMHFINEKFQQTVKKIGNKHSLNEFFKYMVKTLYEEYDDEETRRKKEEYYFSRTDEKGKIKSVRFGYFADPWQKKNKNIIMLYKIAWANYATKLKTPENGSNHA